MKRMIRPDFLSKGDRIAITAPSYAMVGGNALVSACEALSLWGLEPCPLPLALETAPEPFDGVDVYSADAQVRAAELELALRSDEYKAVLCTRGGYGAIHLLDFLKEGAFTDNPKWLIGYSDISVLHAASLAAGVMSIHGNMCGAIGEGVGRDASSLVLKNLLFGKVPQYDLPPCPFNVDGEAEGIMVGGNMISLASLALRREDMLSNEGVILFIEEVGETYHAIDRLLNMLLGSADFCNVRALVFGEFASCRRDLPFASVEEMICPYVRNLGIPVCFHFPAGHGEVNFPFVEGAFTKLKVSGGAEISQEL